MYKINVQTHLCHISGQVGLKHWANCWFCRENEQTIQKAWSRISYVAIFTDYLPLLLSFVISGGVCLVSAAAAGPAGSKSSFASYHASIMLSSLLAAAPHTKKNKSLIKSMTSQIITKMRRILFRTCLNFLLLICSADNTAILRDRRDNFPCVARLNLLLSLLVIDRKETNAQWFKLMKLGSVSKMIFF